MTSSQPSCRQFNCNVDGYTIERGAPYWSRSWCGNDWGCCRGLANKNLCNVSSPATYSQLQSIYLGCNAPRYQLCGNECVDFGFNSKNCGGTGLVCPAGSVCSDAACKVPCNGVMCDANTEVCAPHAVNKCQPVATILPVVKLDNAYILYQKNDTDIPNSLFKIIIDWTTSFYPIMIEQFKDFELKMTFTNNQIGLGFDLYATRENTFSYVYTAGPKVGMNMFTTTFVGNREYFNNVIQNNSHNIEFSFNIVKRVGRDEQVVQKVVDQKDIPIRQVFHEVWSCTDPLFKYPACTECSNPDQDAVQGCTTCKNSQLAYPDCFSKFTINNVFYNFDTKVMNVNGPYVIAGDVNIEVLVTLINGQGDEGDTITFTEVTKTDNGLQIQDVTLTSGTRYKFQVILSKASRTFFSNVTYQSFTKRSGPGGGD